MANRGVAGQARLHRHIYTNMATRHIVVNRKTHPSIFPTKFNRYCATCASFAHADEYVYHEGELAAEWRSWLAGTRDDAPSREEQERAWAKQQQMRARVLEIEAREKEACQRPNAVCLILC
jgi:hypothetical protein